MMRTTINLPEDVRAVIQSLADAKGISLGDAASELIRRGLRAETRVNEDSGFPCFSIPGTAPVITLEHTLAVEDEL